MSIAKNTIRFSDVTTTPIKLKYSSSFASSSLASYGITQNKGVNVPVILSGSMLSPNLQSALKYKTIQQLYYKEYISSSLLGTGSAYDSSLQSTAASGSYDNDIRYIPTGSGDQIRFFAIPTRTFGEQIARKTFAWESLDNSTYKIIDDGNGNVVDAFNNYEHVGNILYAQGIVTVTNSNYLYALSDNHFTFSVYVIPPSPSVSVSPTVTPSISITPSVTPSVSITPSISITPSVTPSVSITPSISITPSVTPSVSKTPSVSVTPSINITPTVTPSITPSRLPVGQCYCFPIVVTGTTIPGPEPTTIATLQYNNCFGELTTRAFTVGPGTYYQCIQVISSVVQYDPVATTGIDQSYLTLTYLTGNCNTGYDCSGYVALSPTPSPTPTLPPSTPSVTPSKTPSVTPSVSVSLPAVGVGIYTGATFASTTLACADSNYPNGGLYLPHGDTISNGDILYTDPACTLAYNGGSLNYRIYQAGFYGCTIGAFGTVSNLLDCASIPASPSPSVTPSATPAATYNYYSVTRYTCPNCTSPVGGLIARNNTTGGTLVTSNYYNNADGYVYRIDGYNAGPTYTIDLDGSASQGTDCTGTCSV